MVIVHLSVVIVSFCVIAGAVAYLLQMGKDNPVGNPVNPLADEEAPVPSDAI